MAPPTKTITNILVGPANFYWAPEGTDGPEDTVPFDTDWGTAEPDWNHPGYTENGLEFSVERKEKRHYVDEISIPAAITIEETTMTIGITFAEPTLENLLLASGGGTITTQAASSTLIGKKTLVLSETLQVLTVGFEGKNAQGFFRRVVIPRVVSVGKIKAEFKRSDNKQMYTAEFESICAITDIDIYDKTGNITN